MTKQFDEKRKKIHQEALILSLNPVFHNTFSSQQISEWFKGIPSSFCNLKGYNVVTFSGFLHLTLIYTVLTKELLELLIFIEENFVQPSLGWL